MGNGPIFHETTNGSQERDKTRFSSFEQAGEQENTDVVCPMYPALKDMKEYADREKVSRTYIMCELFSLLG